MTATYSGAEKWCILCDVLITDELVNSQAIADRSDNVDFCSKSCELAYIASADKQLLANSGVSSIVARAQEANPQARIPTSGKTFSQLLDADGNIKK